ncbi:MAG: EAL domain-containing protein [Methylicorpusculum sp.]|uniref:EAL domain-containing protein n=1 Tax=Methylicorpusculum sp. TaxID=2713644 RepID=UPI00271DB054|nr:EAL domain-containing protein [Methylicorpusculum sp.]MDO8845760.1 EAL domain-containing protein [Methylicorpusculum sp.]MDO8941457.1 EAL domain-containing protein [Methylicorpusculum sp.]MDP2204338.1 EAL domain-containing protein [Methylicorpusculum sp.]
MIPSNACQIMLVEDDPGDAHLISSALRMSRDIIFDVIWVTHLAEAKIKLEKQLPQVLLLDLSLPDSSSIKTVEDLLKEAHSIPIIVLTGHENNELALQALTLGVQDYLVKGNYDSEALIRSISYAISRNQLEQRLAETGSQLRTLINAMPDIVCFKDAEGRWLEANTFDLKLFQLENVDYRGKKDSELAEYQTFYKDAFLACEASDEATWQSGAMLRREETIPRPDNSPLIFDIVKVPLFHDDGRRKGLVVVGRDITEIRKAAERQRLATRVFETTGEAIVVSDATPKIVAVNPAFLSITGFKEDEVLDKDPLKFCFGLHSKDFLRSVLTCLMTKGLWNGEMFCSRRNGEVFPVIQTISTIKDELGNITHYTAIFSDLSDIKRAQHTADRLSWSDPLTNLANRALFLKQMEQTLEQAYRDGHFANVLLIDIDRFKSINEVRGMDMGDDLLKSVAMRLEQCMKPNDLLARLDSDEFAILQKNTSSDIKNAMREAAATSERMRATLREGIILNGETFYLDICIGINLFPKSSTETAIDVLREADIALNQAKAKGEGQTVIFESALSEAIIERFQLENELRLAISLNQLKVYLQPQVNAAGQQVGAEALVRWPHEKRGMVFPNLFIPLAEASNLIIALDRWMLSEVCQLLAKLEQGNRGLRISVNISPRHFDQADFVEKVIQIMKTTGANPAHLALEVTESLVINDINEVAEKMSSLTALGVHFSMDDFGTGYSSLSYLKRLPIQEIKIDKSFIQDILTNASDAALVETIIAVAKHLNLRIVAEGVETKDQADFLNTLGSVVHQGYFFGRPEPVENWLENFN